MAPETTTGVAGMQVAAEVRYEMHQGRMTTEQVLATVGLDVALADLQGTPRQVEWAAKIRAGYILRTAEYLTSSASMSDREPLMLAGVRRMARATNAAWWINRHTRCDEPLEIAASLGAKELQGAQQ